MCQIRLIQSIEKLRQRTEIDKLRNYWLSGNINWNHYSSLHAVAPDRVLAGEAQDLLAKTFTDK